MFAKKSTFDAFKRSRIILKNYKKHKKVKNYNALSYYFYHITRIWRGKRHMWWSCKVRFVKIYYYQHRSLVIIIGNLNGFPVSWPKHRRDSCANAWSDCQTVSGLVADVTMQAVTVCTSNPMRSSLRSVYFTSAQSFRPLSSIRVKVPNF